MVPDTATAHTMLSITEASNDLRISRTTVWRLAKEGKLPVVKIGRRALIRRADLVRFADSLSNTIH
jgi:excisionase family DNA binding protein